LINHKQLKVHPPFGRFSNTAALWEDQRDHSWLIRVQRHLHLNARGGTRMTFGYMGSHKQDLATFQKGEVVFVWGLDTTNGEMWHLQEDTGKVSRPHVKERVVCPVPGCGEKLTSAHRAKKRDGLVHWNSKGGHSIESILHSQGCALIENWLRQRYPNSIARREEYTNEQGERRADVLLTAPTGERVAFEVQYSALTPDAWKRRHDSYRAQGIVDVWIFGHIGSQLKIDKEGLLKPNPTHQAVVKSGSALWFINPLTRMLGIATSEANEYSAELDGWREGTVSVWDTIGRRARIEIYPLTDFEVQMSRGLGGGRLTELYKQTASLRKRNISAPPLAKEAWARKEEEDAAHKTLRSEQQLKIRAVLGWGGRWSQSAALAEIKAYFGTRPNRRFHEISDPGAPAGLLVRWQCVIYFTLIAGQNKPFGALDAVKSMRAHKVSTADPGVFKAVARWLCELEEFGLLERIYPPGKYPSWRPTEDGTWW
jgi:hypothetical protein